MKILYSVRIMDKLVYSSGLDIEKEVDFAPICADLFDELREQYGTWAEITFVIPGENNGN